MMGIANRVLYGVGGFDPAKPNNNVIISETVTTSAVEDNYDAILTWLDNVIPQGENAVTNWSTLSAAQKDAALKQVVQAVTRLARLVRNNLASPGA